MRAFCIVLMALLVASVAVAEDKDKLFVQPIPSGLRALDCSNAIPIDCGAVVTGDNTGAPNNVDLYSCVAWSEGGGEVVYELVIPEGQCFTVTGTITDLAADLDVFFLGSCDENDCLTYGNTTFTSSCLEPGTYYIVVDGYGTAASAFTLTVDCVECDCPVPACCPFQNVRYVVDFNEWDGEFMLFPCGGVPTWEWGPMTNPEVPYIACDDVPVTNILGTTIAGDYPAGGGEVAAVGPFFIDQYSTCLERRLQRQGLDGRRSHLDAPRTLEGLRPGAQHGQPVHPGRAGVQRPPVQHGLPARLLRPRRLHRNGHPRRVLLGQRQLGAVSWLVRQVAEDRVRRFLAGRGRDLGRHQGSVSLEANSDEPTKGDGHHARPSFLVLDPGRPHLRTSSELRNGATHKGAGP